MYFKKQLSNIFFKISALFFLFLFSFLSVAGQISFSIEYNDKNIILKNSGSESVYELDIYTVGSNQTWVKSEVQIGSFLSIGQTIESQRSSGSRSNPLSIADPVLLVGNEQSGAVFTQLAWRKPFPVSKALLPFSRQGRYVALNRNNAIVRSIIFYYPKDSIQSLAEPIKTKLKPPDPVIVEWSVKNNSQSLDTGLGEAGLWILNEFQDGELGVQIIGDGLVKGKEQVPWWLEKIRTEGFIWSLMLMSIGIALTVIGGLFALLKQRR